MARRSWTATRSAGCSYGSVSLWLDDLASATLSPWEGERDQGAGRCLNIGGREGERATGGDLHLRFNRQPCSSYNRRGRSLTMICEAAKEAPDGAAAALLEVVAGDGGGA